MKKILIICIALMAFGSFFSLHAALSNTQQGGTVFYFYDENGRLRSTVRSDGQIAIYQYDASGNIVSISRQPTPSSISSFTPNSGLVNTQVTINGNGFGATAADNRVLFNGILAQIVSATAVQIVAIVPTDATTGPIMVITATGAAVSATPFTVTQPSPDLTITNFTPTVGSSGTVVTINGTNFDTIATNNRVEFNGSVATVTSATATTLIANVPATATSGHIKITTPIGSAVSNGDFFIPIPPTSPSQIEVTGRMAIGETKTVNITSPGKEALIVFDGVAGDKVSLLVNSYTSSGSGTLIVYTPTRTVFGSFFLSTGAFIDAKALPATGTYTIRLIAPAGRTASVTFTLHRVPADATVTALVGGPQVAVPLAVPGQNAVVTFNGTAGQRISILVPPLASNSTLKLFDPGLNLIASDTARCCVGELLYIDALTLSTTGAYRVEINPIGSISGNILCQIYEVPPDALATITPGGASVPVVISVPGQNARLTFNGTAGQRVSLLANYTGMAVAISVLKPDLTTLQPSQGASSEQQFIDPITLPISGVYTIVLDAYQETIGTITCSLIDVPDDVTGVITPNGQPTSISTTTPGQNATLTFNATAGQRFSLFAHFTAGSSNQVFGISIQGRDVFGAIVFNSNTIFTDGGFFDAFSGNVAASSYTISLNPGDAFTGTFTVTLYDVPADVTGSISSGGAPVSVPIIAPGQNALLTFTGTAGQRLRLKISGTPGFNGDVKVFRSNNTLIDAIGFTEEQPEVFLETFSLPTTGNYRLEINPRLSSTGTRTFTLYNLMTITGGTVAINGPPVTVDLTASDQGGTLKDAELTFTVPIDGQFITLAVTNNITGCVDVALVAPDGFPFSGRGSCDGSPITFDSQIFNAGTYKIKIKPVGTSAGSVTLRLTSP